MVSQVHVRNDKHTMMKEFLVPLPGVDAFEEKQVSIPVGWWVSDKERESVVKAVKEFYQRYGSE